ncbi:hypothetical protein ACM0BF_14345 [Mycobacteroides abscessus subsp. abscessus]|uniref:hypothetical protein n=1 Tax=Mycobacteroides abscessus TaxID=36809 RepID=UPI0039EEEB76
MTKASTETPVSKLFLSCDLTGSTAFKQRPNPDPKTPWQKVFLQFYREFPQQVYKQQTALGFTALGFKIWKAVGDELIFTCDVKSEVDVHQAIEVWIATLRAFKCDNLDGHPQLGVKGGAFIGTFPAPDYESTIPLEPDIEVSDKDVVLLNRKALSGRRATTKYLYDYFGPSIDTGFRVLSKCSDRYMTLSLEVAYALAVLQETPTRDGTQYEHPDLMLLDSIELKGVWGGRDYPLFCIDLAHDDEVNKAFRDFQYRVTTQQIRKLCQACYESDGWPFCIYLPDAQSDHFGSTKDDLLGEYLKTATTEYSGMEEQAEDAPDASGLRENPPLE